MKKLSIIVAIVLSFTSCTKEALEETLTYDHLNTFNLPDQYGLGKPTIGNEYELLGTDPVNDDGFYNSKIQNHRWITEEDKNVYAIQTSSVTQKYVTAKLRWTQAKANPSLDGVFIFIMSKYGGGNFVTNALHLRCTTLGISLDVFNSGRIKGIEDVSFRTLDDAPRRLDFNRDYRFCFYVDRSIIYYSVYSYKATGDIDEIILKGKSTNYEYENKIGNVVTYEQFKNIPTPANEMSVAEIGSSRYFIPE